MKQGNNEIIAIPKNKLFNIGLIIVLVNPLLAGLAYGIFLRFQKELKSEGNILITLSLLWGGIALALFSRLSGI